MSKSPPSSVPSPRSPTDPSPRLQTGERPKYLARTSHDVNLREPRVGTSPGKFADEKNKSSQPEPARDSAHFRAAQLLRDKRIAAGLSQEELGYLSGESPKQIGKRERGEVKLGALRVLLILERAAGLKAQKGSK